MKHLLLLLPFIYISSFAQTSGCMPPAINYSVNCGDDSTQLNATPGYDSYSWAPASGLSNPSVANPMALLNGTTYTLTTTSATLGPELVVNGDFSLGNTGFTSGQTYSTTYSPCNYYVGNLFFTTSFPGVDDHTPTADGIYMSIDGCTTSEILWEETIPIINPFSIYKFEFWSSRADAVQPIFEIHMIGNVTGDIVEATQNDIPYTGTNMYDAYGLPTWNSGANTNVIIRIINLETNGYGNDFELDDFLFRKNSCSSSTIVTVPDASSGTSAPAIIPNTFTPNNDGKNDELKFDNLILSNCKIYDRWGLLIKEMNETDASWNGKNKNGEPCSDGVYFYILSGKAECGGEMSKTGFIQIIR